MNPEQIVVGIVSPSPETREHLRSRLAAGDSSPVQVEADQYCGDRNDRVTRRLIEAKPDIILVDLRDQSAALRALNVLHDVLPEAWLLVSSPSADPQLIIDTMRAGAREFLPQPVTSSSLAQAFARYCADRSKARERRTPGKLYCVTAAKGGAGTTSIAVNLAAAVATGADSRVALIDFGRPVGDAADYLNLKSQFSVSDALASCDRLDPVLLETYMSRAHGIAVLRGLTDFRPGVLRPDAIARVLNVAADTYTHAFIDMFHSNEQDQLQVVTELVTSVVLVLTPELPALWRTRRLIELLETMDAAHKLCLVVNRSAKHDEIGDREIEKTLGQSIYWRLPNNYPAAIQAINSGNPIVSVNHSNLASSYMQLAETLTGISLKKKRRGLFG